MLTYQLLMIPENYHFSKI